MLSQKSYLFAKMFIIWPTTPSFGQDHLLLLRQFWSIDEKRWHVGIVLIKKGRLFLAIWQRSGGLTKKIISPGQTDSSLFSWAYLLRIYTFNTRPARYVPSTLLYRALLSWAPLFKLCPPKLCFVKSCSMKLSSLEIFSLVLFFLRFFLLHKTALEYICM